MLVALTTERDVVLGKDVLGDGAEDRYGLQDVGGDDGRWRREGSAGRELHRAAAGRVELGGDVVLGRAAARMVKRVPCPMSLGR